jgi:hypothetical protein
MIIEPEQTSDFGMQRLPAPLWNPDVARLRQEPADAHVVVDEPDEGALVLVAPRWPEVDSQILCRRQVADLLGWRAG